MRKRYYGWVAGGLLLLLVVAATAVVIQRNQMPDELDTSTTKLSEDGLYRVAIIPAVEPVPINQMHSWTLEVLTVDGLPVDDAVIGVNG
jgi:hypothetical protein